jgi:phosphomannomutase/phosphoglucomutase
MTTRRRRLFGTNGIRGIPGRDLTLEFVVEISQAIGTYFKEGPILVGYDGRSSGPVLARAVAAGLMAAGLDVSEAGMLPTPALQYAVRALNYRGGVMVTASHNPPEYNGIKVVGPEGVEIPREDEVRIEELYYTRSYTSADWRSLGRSFREERALHTYIQGILAYVDAERVRAAGLKVALDPGNGVQALAAPQVVERLGCRLMVINSDVDGGFPGRGPEPTPDNLKELAAVVREGGYDLGVAYDGDGDRSIFVDERGAVHWGDKSGSLLVDYLLSKNRGATVVTTISTTQMVEEVAGRWGGRVVRTKVGSVDVSRRMLELNALCGLEENGGFFYGPLNPVRDGAMTTALMLEVLATTGKRLSELIAALPRYYQKKTKLPCPRERAAGVLEELAARFEGYRVERVDGLKVWVDEHSWVLVRPSGTEPIIRVFAESDREGRVESLLEEFTTAAQTILARQGAASPGAQP